YAPIYAQFGVALAFTHPKTRKPALLTAVNATLAHDGGGLGLSVASRRLQYCVLAADLAALGLAPADMDGVGVSVDGQKFTVDSSAQLPGPAFGLGEIGLNLIVAK
ncbi:MAG: hypothetical protein KGL35_00375, partial [Bradyrhizobium sp.]|nr:hypothetical protein [Bradyrhizobium sp.]